MAQWNPLNDLVSLQDRMNRLFEDATQRPGQADPSDEVEGAEWCPAADVYENDAAYTVAVDLPGIDRTTLHISVDQDTLAIKGIKPGLDTTQHRTERPKGKFLRTFSVPAAVDLNEIKADYKDGVLQVYLPKRPERKAQRVEIKIS